MENKIDIRGEELLLIGLCRLRITEENIIELNHLAEAISDWDYFERLAVEHGIAALVYHNMGLARIESHVPTDVLSSLKNSRLLSMTRNAFHMEAAKELAATLSGPGLKCILLKGMALELCYYGNTGLRQMTDIDILLRREDCIPVREMLIGSGYTSYRVKSVFHKPILLYTGKHMPTLVKNGESVDIHHQLFGSSGNALTDLFITRSTPANLGELKVFMPDPQLLFLYLVKHLVQHELNGESQLRLYTDLVVLLEKDYDKIINPELTRYSSEAELTDHLFAKLFILRKWWGFIYPDWLEDLVNQNGSSNAHKIFLLFLKKPKNNASRDKSSVYRNNIREIPGLHRKILFVLGDLFPTITFMKQRYSCKFSISALLYYPHRFGKLLMLFN